MRTAPTIHDPAGCVALSRQRTVRTRVGERSVSAAAASAKFLALACALAALLPGVCRGAAIVAQTIEVEGAVRTYYLYMPATMQPAGNPPLLVVLHWTTGNGRAALRPWTALADREGMVLVAPDATTPVGWRIREDGPAYLRSIIAAVASQTPFDPRRVYLFGVSAGAVHALTVGVLESEYFAAIAVYAGSWRDRESFLTLDYATRKIPVAIEIGDRDELFPMRSVLATQAALVSAGHPFALKVLPGEDHEYAGVALKASRDAWAFLKPVALTDPPRFREYR